MAFGPAVGATVITVLSWLGIPASLAVSTTSCIIGLGWGRASRPKTLAEIATPVADARPGFTTGALVTPPTADPEEAVASPTVGDLAAHETPETGEQQAADGGVPDIGEADGDDIPAESLFDPTAAAGIVVLWVLSPTPSVVGAYLPFSLLV